MRIKTVLWLLLLGLIIYAGTKIGSVYLDYARMKDTMSVKAGVAQVLKDDEILNDLAIRAKELDLPLGKENFVLQRNEEKRTMSIKTAWDVEVHFFGNLYVHTFHFEPRVEEALVSR